MVDWTAGLADANAAERAAGHLIARIPGSPDVLKEIPIADLVFKNGSGNVGIGTTTPTLKLDVNGSVGIQGVGNALVFDTAGAAQANYLTTVNSFDMRMLCGRGVTSSFTAASDSARIEVGGTERMRIDSSGNLLVGTTADSSTSTANGLVLSGSIPGYVISRRASGAAQTHFIFVNGGNTVGVISTSTTNTTYATSSDARLKDNIADADNASSLIDALQVRKFDWKADGSHQRYGFVAQELVEVAPEAVSVPQDENAMMGVDYSKLVPMLVKEIQCLRARVAQLEGQPQ